MVIRVRKPGVVFFFFFLGGGVSFGKVEGFSTGSAPGAQNTALVSLLHPAESTITHDTVLPFLMYQNVQDYTKL